MIWLILAGIFIPFGLTLLLFPIEKKYPAITGLFSACFHALSFLCFGFAWYHFNPEQPQVYSIPWVPSASVNLSFLVDGLSLYFAFLVSGVGVLINVYANYYMSEEYGSLRRFYSYLNLFATSMLGAVFANNLLLMFLFWEMTGIASFLLIGYHYEDEETAQTSRSIFLFISIASVFLLFGVILLGMQYGTFEWTEIVSRDSQLIEGSTVFSVILVFFLIGIFGKSAQIPFHFWLPKAMCAPTPVSAYLHAATMVKLGVYLTARMFPLFVSHPLWFPAVTTVSYTTMLLGAIFSLLSNDMKQILAYATVSQLGAFIGLYGIGNEVGVAYDFIHILNHALYKGSLFMLAGIIAHATGIRDIRYLGGLWNKLPFTMTIFAIATAAMIGIPGTIGFVSKEILLGEVVNFGETSSTGSVILWVLITALVVKVAFSLRFFYHIFFDKREKHEELLHPPGIAVQVPALVLSSLALIFGLWPPGLEDLSKTFFVSGLHRPDLEDLSIWHGWTIEIGMSIGILAAGAALFRIAEKWQFWKVTYYMADFSATWNRALEALSSGAKKLTSHYLSPSPSVNLGYMFSAALLAGAWLLVYGGFPTLQHGSADPIQATTSFFMILTTLCIPLFRYWISKLIALSISGFFVTLFFVLFKGPDLAITQLLVEVVSIFLLLALFWGILKEKDSIIKKEKISIPHLVLSIGVGLTMGLIAMGFRTAPFEADLGDYFLKTSFRLDPLTNVVNLILVDFRGFDTMGETMVLMIAALGVVRVLFRQAPQKLPFGHPIRLLPSHILKRTIPFIFFVVNTLALYFLFRGHTAPGGGFIGGLASGTAFVLISLSIQQDEISEVLRIGLLKLCTVGLAIVLLSCTLPMLMGEPFLSQKLPATPLLFEIGIFLVVLGMSVIVIFSMRDKILKEEA